MHCRLVTWNIHSCVGTDGAYDPGRTAEVLRGLDADIIGLQEVDWRTPPFDGMDQLTLMAQRLAMTPVAGPNLRDHRGEYGNGLLTRLEVREVRRVHLAHDASEPRGAIDALLTRDGHRLRVLVTHLGLRRRERRLQAQAIRAAVERGADAVVLLADLNEWMPGLLVGDILAPEP
ncbi:MAG: endonuclease/exonuclease/phosphatase family protein, partial [Phycisphaerales bacterium]|nr:endonuclease/exonuclease/phosphatase family protein [Phycisphaerales bacterium]